MATGKRRIDYGVAWGATMVDLVECAEEMIDEGFDPIGGVAVDRKPSGELWFYQTMVRRNDAVVTPSPCGREREGVKR